MTAKQSRVFEILRKHGPLSVSGIAQIADPNSKPDHIIVSNITYALKGLEENGLVKTNKTKRPFTVEVDPDGLKEHVTDAINYIASEFFHGDVDALVHFIDTSFAGGQKARAKTKQTKEKLA